MGCGLERDYAEDVVGYSDCIDVCAAGDCLAQASVGFEQFVLPRSNDMLAIDVFQVVFV